MADIIYTVNQDLPEDIFGFEQYSQEDRDLIPSFQINSVFDPQKHYSELYILSLSDEILESIPNYTGYTQLGNAQSAGQDGASVLTIDPILDAKAYGYTNGGVKLLYHFLDDLYTQDSTTSTFYIQEISPDRTEISLASTTIAPEVLTSTTSAIKEKLQSQSYFSGFRLNFANNDLFIATNIDTLSSDKGIVVVVKLYEPLPTTYNVKSKLNVVDLVSDSAVYEVDAEFVIEPEVAPTLKAPNFNIEIADESVVPTGYSNYNELFNYSVNNANSELYSLINEKGININVDYEDFSSFVHFSSAQERLLNFKYKVDLLTSYSSSISLIGSSTTGLQGISGSRSYYEGLTTGVLGSFDHYERFLYYESGSSSWPKSNDTKPYTNIPSKDPITNVPNSTTTAWFTAQVEEALLFDQNNNNSLVYSIPAFLRDDNDNERYLTFVYMVGQHFDNLWLYAKAVTDKYDADNRLTHGISKDLVGEALKNFGVKLYTSNKSTEDLFSTFIGQAYQSGSEVINNYITGSLTGSNTPIQPASYDGYQKEVQKRIYHNLPLLLKSKGTERGLRALINCFGIPSDILKIKLYGGRNVDNLPFYGDYQYYTSSLDKIRTDHTGSITPGDTLSQYTSIVHRDYKYTDDLHAIEVGFSPTDNIDNYIISQSVSTFNIDNYIGDPRDLSSDSYSGLGKVAESILGNLDQYNLQDYVRLIKFFDNVIFKMVKDFIPARAIADTGIIIKPNLLNRSKAKSVSVSGSQPEYFGIIDTAFISASDGGIYQGSEILTTNYTASIQTPIGTSSLSYNEEQAKYNGELSGSYIVVSNGELNASNPYKEVQVASATFDVRLVSSSVGVCVLRLAASPPLFIEPNKQYGVERFFTGTTANTTYTANGNPIVPNPSFNFTGLVGQYDPINLTATVPDLINCTIPPTSIPYGVCDLYTRGTISVYPYQIVDLTQQIFNSYPQQTNLEYSHFGLAIPSNNLQSYYFKAEQGLSQTVKLRDLTLSGCEKILNVSVQSAPIPDAVVVSFYRLNLNQNATENAIIRYTDKESITTEAILTPTSRTVGPFEAKINPLYPFYVSDTISSYTTPPGSFPLAAKIIDGGIQATSIVYRNISNLPIKIKVTGYYFISSGFNGPINIDTTLAANTNLPIPLGGTRTAPAYIEIDYPGNRFTYSPSINGKLEVTFTDNY